MGDLRSTPLRIKGLEPLNFKSLTDIHSAILQQRTGIRSLSLLKLYPVQLTLHHSRPKWNLHTLCLAQSILWAKGCRTWGHGRGVLVIVHKRIHGRKSHLPHHFIWIIFITNWGSAINTFCIWGRCCENKRKCKVFSMIGCWQLTSKEWQIEWMTTEWRWKDETTAGGEENGYNIKKERKQRHKEGK